MDKINKIILRNQSATVCALECYYKLNSNDDAKRVGTTGNFPVAQEGLLDLNYLGIPDGALVTAYANVKWGADSSGDEWFIFSKDWDAEACFELTGSAFSTDVSLVYVEQCDFDAVIGDMTAYRVDDAVESLKNLPQTGRHEKIKGLRYFSNLGIEHVQGYTQYEHNGKVYYLFTHHTTGDYGYILQATNDSDETLSFMTPKGWNHPAGIQCLGQYLFVPCEEGSEARIFVYDILHNMKKVKTLRCSHRAGCIGVTDFNQGNENYCLLLVGDQQVYYAYIAKKSTSMRDLNFTYFGKIDLGANRTDEQDEFFMEEDINCQGFGLVTDKEENVHMLALMTHGCKDRVFMIKLNINISERTFSYDTEVSAHLINKGGIAGDYGSHFRWGAGIRITPLNNLVVLATSRNIIAGTKLDTTSWYKH